MTSAVGEIDKICSTLDKLTLDALSLMEEEIQLKLNIENTMCAGETHLAKARYIMGQNNVSSLQLPSENSPEFSAQTKVYSAESDKLFGKPALELHLETEVEDDDNATIKDPLRWFGYLVPQNLNYAQNMFRQALQWVVQAANIQTQLMETCTKIKQLTEAKKNINAKN